MDADTALGVAPTLTGISLPPVPQRAIGSAPQIPTADALKATIAQKQAAQAPIVAGINKTINSPKPADPGQTPVEKAPDFKSVIQQDGGAWVNAMAVFAALVGAKSRQHATTALNAFAGGVKGLNDGNQQAFENSYKTWEANTKAALDNNKEMLDKYDAVLKDRSLNLAEKEAQFKLIGAQYDDKIQADTMDFTTRMKAYDVAQAQQAKAQEHTDRMMEAHEWWKEQQEYKDKEKSAPSISKDMAKFAVDQLLAGDKSALYNYGRGEKATANLSLIHETLQEVAHERGITGAQLAKINAEFAGAMSEAHAIGRRAGTTEAGVGEFDQLIEPTRDSIHRLDMGAWKDWNSFVSSFDEHTNDPDYIEAYNNIQEVQNAYTSVLIKGGVRTDSAQNLSEHTINTLFGSKGSDRALDTMAANTKRIMAGINKAKAGTVGQSEPPEEAIQHLKDNPGLKQDFDAKYGSGAADKYLSGAYNA